MIIACIASPYLAVPVETETYFVELLTITAYILFGGYCRVLTCLYSILLSRKTVCIVTHWVKHIVSLQSFETCENIGSDIPERVTYVKPGTRRIGEHIKNIKFLLILIFNNFVGFVFLPSLLPLLFNLVKIVCHIFESILFLFLFNTITIYLSRCNKLQI